MNCRQAYLWMLSADEAEGPLPPELRRHLRLCRKCVRRRRRLLRLSLAVRESAPPADDPAARARIMAALPWDRIPILSGMVDRIGILSHGRRRFPRIIPWAMAAAAVLLVGILAGAFAFLRRDHPGAAPPVASANPGADAPSSPGSPSEPGDLLHNVVQRDLALAQAEGAADQFQTVAALAGDLWNEAERQARRTEPLDLPLLTHLYERVAAQGVVGRALALDEGERRELAPPVADQLRQTAEAADRLAVEVREAAPDLDRLAAASRGAARAIQGEGPPRRPAAAPPDDLPPDATPRQLLLKNLVAQGLRMAEEDDPLRRADCGVVMIDSLTQTIVKCSDSADGEELARLGGYVAAVQSQAVDDNLARVPVDGPDNPAREELDRVKQHAADAMGQLDQSVQKAPPPERPALARAAEAAHDAPPPAFRDKVPPGLARHGKGPAPPGKKKKHGPDG